MEVNWSQDYSFLISRPGGRHIFVNFMKVTGQQFQSSGLHELWPENDLLGEKTTERVLARKDCEKSEGSQNCLSSRVGDPHATVLAVSR